MARARFQDPSLQKAGKGKTAYYFIRFRIYREDGTFVNKQETVGLVSMGVAEAKKRKAEILKEKTFQLPQMHKAARGTTTFKEFYEDVFLVMKPNWTEAHRESFRYIMDSFLLPQFGNVSLESIDEVHIQARLNALAKKYSQSTLKHVRTKMYEVLEFAFYKHYITNNPATRTVIPNEAREPNQPVLTKDQLIALIDKLTDARDKAIFCSGTFCALRTSELFGMPWRNFHHQVAGEAYFMVDQIAYRGKLYKRTKNDASKARVHIGPRTLKAVLQWQKECSDTGPDALMFASTNLNGRAKKGAPMFPGTWLQKRLQPIAKELGIEFKVNFRATRRTAATLIQDQGSSLASAQSVLRHASPNTTSLVYTKPVEKSVQKAVNDYEDSVFAARPKPVRIK